MRSFSRTKYHAICDKLTEAIRCGEFKSGEPLPGERELASRFGVSHMTARRAVGELVEASLLERRGRAGTCVRVGTTERLATTTLHLICAPYENSITKDFRRLVFRQVEARGWELNVIYLLPGSERQAVRTIRSGEPTLVLSDEFNFLVKALGEAMQQASGRAVLLANRLDSLGVPSVLADDAHAIRLAVEHLRERGHCNIALISNHAQHPIERTQIAAWRNCLAGRIKPAQLEQWLVTVDTPRFECPTRYTYEALRSWLAAERANVSALICLEDEMTLGVLHACRDAGIAVPEQMSLINAGDSSLMETAHPPVTSIDVNLESHIRLAMQMLDAAREGRLEPLDRLRVVEPHLIERQSVSNRRR